MEYKKLQAYFFIALLVGVLGLTLFVFAPFLAPLLVGATFAIVFKPFHRKILGFMPNKESVAAMITVFFVLILVLTPLIFFGIQVLQEVRQLYVSFVSSDVLPNFSHTLIVKIKELLPSYAPLSTEEISSDLNQYIAQTLNWLVQNLGTIFSSAVRISFSLLIALFAFYYLLKDGKKFKKEVVSLSPLADHYDKEILEKLLVVVNSVIKGTLVVSIVQGILAGIGFFVFGIPNAALWGSVTVIASLIPILGTSLVTVPAVAYLFIIGNTPAGFGLLVWVFVLVGFIDNFLRPKVIERGVHLHPFLILLSVIGGIGVFGPIGFLVGPLILSLCFALLNIYRTEFKEYVAS